jgi:hypothetical protein
LLLAVPRTTRAGSIIYDIQNYPSQQNGHTLEGTITTDGQIGPLAFSDITSWSVTIDNTITFRSTDAGSSTVLLGDVQATSTSITLSAPASINPNYLSLGDLQGILSWQRAAGTTLGIYGAIYVPVGNLWTTTSTTLGGNDPWVIAAVPEPSSLWMAVSGISASLAYGWFRHRREAARKLTGIDAANGPAAREASAANGP